MPFSARVTSTSPPNCAPAAAAAATASASVASGRPVASASSRRLGVTRLAPAIGLEGAPLGVHDDRHAGRLGRRHHLRDHRIGEDALGIVREHDDAALPHGRQCGVV